MKASWSELHGHVGSGRRPSIRSLLFGWRYLRVSGARSRVHTMNDGSVRRGVRLCCIAAAGLQQSTGSPHDDDVDIVTLGAMQPPLVSQGHSSGNGVSLRRRAVKASLVQEESPDQILDRLLRHTFGSALGSTFDDELLTQDDLRAPDEADSSAVQTEERGVVDKSPTEEVEDETEHQLTSLESTEMEEPATAAATADSNNNNSSDELENKELSVETGVAADLDSLRGEGFAADQSDDQGGEAVADDVHNASAVPEGIPVELEGVVRSAIDSGKPRDDASSCDGSCDPSVDQGGRGPAGVGLDKAEETGDVAAVEKPPEGEEASNSEGGSVQHPHGGAPAPDGLRQEEAVGRGSSDGSVPLGDAHVSDTGDAARTVDSVHPTAVDPRVDMGALEADGIGAPEADEATVSEESAEPIGFPDGDGVGTAGAEAGSREAGEAMVGVAEEAGLDMSVGEVAGVTNGRGADIHDVTPQTTDIDGPDAAVSAGTTAAVVADEAVPARQDSDSHDNRVDDVKADADDLPSVRMLAEEFADEVEDRGATGLVEPHGSTGGVPLVGKEARGHVQELSLAVDNRSGDFSTQRSDDGDDGSVGDTSREEDVDVPVMNSTEGRGVEHEKKTEPVQQEAVASESSESTRDGGMSQAEDTAEPYLGIDGETVLDAGEGLGVPPANVGTPIEPANEQIRIDASQHNPPWYEDGLIEDGSTNGEAEPLAAGDSEPAPTRSGRRDGLGGEVGLGTKIEKPTHKRPIFRFSKQPNSVGTAHPGDLAGMASGLESDNVMGFTLPPLPPIDVSPASLQGLSTGGDSPSQVTDSIETGWWDTRRNKWVAAAKETAMRWASVACERGAVFAKQMLAIGMARMVKIWHEVIEPQVERMRRRLYDVAMFTVEKIGEHLEDPVLAEAL